MPTGDAVDSLHHRILEQFQKHPDKKLTPGNIIIMLKGKPLHRPESDEEIIAAYELLLEAGHLKDEPINGVHHASLVTRRPQTDAGVYPPEVQ